jgi:hypothetical protein
MAEVLNLYIDASRKRDELKSHLSRLKKTCWEKFFAECPADHNLLEYFLDQIFQEGAENSFYFSNTSLKEGDFNITIRPRIDNRPRLLEKFPKGLVLGIRGRLIPAKHPQPMLAVTAIAELPDAPLLPFEAEFAAVSYTRPINIHPHSARTNSVLSPSYMSSLPLISVITRNHLRGWREYLEWTMKILQSKLSGLRYLQADSTEDGMIRFLAVARTEDELAKFIGLVRQYEIKAHATGVSTDKWIYTRKPEYKGPSIKIGDFNKSESLSELPENYDGETPVLETYAAAYLYFNLAEGVSQDFMSDIPATGFLVHTATGDFVQNERQMQELNRLEMQSGYAPFLNSYIFDISAAPLPDKIIEVNNWMFPFLDEEQKLAIRKAISTPAIFFLQGPPGTGKTIVAAESTFQLVTRGERVLIASQSNLAVDNVLSKIALNPAIRAIRLGKEEKISEDLKYSKKNAVGTYYKSIATACRERFLDTWRKMEKQIAEIEQWLQNTGVVYSDINRLNEELDKMRSRKVEIEKAYSIERISAEERRVHNQELEEIRIIKSLLQEYANGQVA